MLGPYLHGLGKRNKKTDDDYIPVAKKKACDEKGPETIQTRQRKATYQDAEVIPKFDPAAKINAKTWLHKIDQLGDIYDWDEKDRTFIMQIRLRGVARAWYDDLDDYSGSWDAWKENIVRAFPRSTDYVDILQEMLSRLKERGETTSRYYYDKMTLLRKCNIEEEAALSCLIRGLPEQLRFNAKAFNAKTPEDLYYGFLSGLENYQQVAVTNRSDMELKTQRDSRQSGRQFVETATGTTRVCDKCRKPGHTFHDCRAERCQNCSRLGHSVATCWQSPRSTQGSIQVKHV